MSIFKCAKCGCAENTVLGWYHLRKNLADYADFSQIGEQYRGEPLCSECAPTRFKDGSPTGFTGQWHGRFPKKPYTEDIVVVSPPKRKTAYVPPKVNAVLVPLKPDKNPPIPDTSELNIYIAPQKLPEITILSPTRRYPDGHENRRKRRELERKKKKK